MDVSSTTPKIRGQRPSWARGGATREAPTTASGVYTLLTVPEEGQREEGDHLGGKGAATRNILNAELTRLYSKKTGLNGAR